jgi:hypothetical protein
MNSAKTIFYLYFYRFEQIADLNSQWYTKDAQWLCDILSRGLPSADGTWLQDVDAPPCIQTVQMSVHKLVELLRELVNA